MERKPVGGKIRNIERSRKRFLLAVGRILKTKGHAGLKINEVAKVAGVDKKMIYKYFGGLEGLIDEYINVKDFWSNVKAEQTTGAITDGGKAFAHKAFLDQFDYLECNKELQKLLLWRLSEERKSLRKLTQDQEASGELLFNHFTDPYFGKNAEKFRAISAILASGLYYLNMYAEVNGSVFSGIDLKTENGRNLIKEAIGFILDKSFEDL